MRTVLFSTAVIAGVVWIGIEPANAGPQSVSGIGNTNIQAATVESVGYRRRYYRRYYRRYGYPAPYAYYPPAYGYYGPPSAYAYPPAIGHYPPPDGNYADAPPQDGDYANAPFHGLAPLRTGIMPRSAPGKLLIELQDFGLAASLLLAQKQT